MTKPLRIVFLGTSDFAVASLEALLADPAFTVTAVITQPDKPTGRRKALTASPVKISSLQAKIPIYQPENINAQVSSLTSQVLQPDFLVAVAYGQILSQDSLDFPRIAPVNLHASLLPKFRGAAPIQHALLAAEQETGVTVQQMAKALDRGDILSQHMVPIAPRETFVSLHETLKLEGAKLLVHTLKNPLMQKKQNERLATFCTKLSRSDGLVDPQTMTAEEIDRKVRALNPWPGVRLGKLKLIETSLMPSDLGFVLDCKSDTKLFVTKVQPDGKKEMTGKEYGRGNRT